MLIQFSFYFIASFIVLAALGVVLASNIVYSVFSFLLCLVGISILFALLGADFLALMQLILYGSAVVVLFLFVVFFLKQKQEKISFLALTYFLVALSLGSTITGGITLAIKQLDLNTAWQKVSGTTQVLTVAIFSPENKVLFVFSAFILLLTLIATVWLVNYKGKNVANEIEEK